MSEQAKSGRAALPRSPKKQAAQQHRAASTLREDALPYRVTDALGYHLHTAIIDAQSVVPQHRERIFLVGFKERRAFEFPAFPAQGPKLASISTGELLAFAA